MRRHHEGHFDDLFAFVTSDEATAALGELFVHLLAAGIVLDGAQDAVGAAFEGVDELAEGVRQHPGVLIQQVNVRVAFLHRLQHTDVVGGAESDVGTVADDFHAVLLEPLDAAVCGAVVYGDDVCGYGGCAHGAYAPLQPAHPVESHYDDKYFRVH